jgi:hypothetical protein
MTDHADIDRAIALEVMGWEAKIKEPGQYGSWKEMYFEPGQTTCLLFMNNDNWHPTKDMNQAMLVVEKLMKPGLSITIERWPSMSFPDPYSVTLSGANIRSSSSDTSLPLVICAAALQVRRRALVTVP